MGEEYGEDTPFFFFSDYQEPATSRGQAQGRREQFAAFGFDGEVRDPQDPALFDGSKLHWEKRGSGDHRVLLGWHRELIRLRRTHPLLSDLSKRFLRVDVLGAAGLSVYRYSAAGDRHLVCLYNFSHRDPLVAPLGYAALRAGTWKLLLSSEGSFQMARSGRDGSHTAEPGLPGGPSPHAESRIPNASSPHVGPGMPTEVPSGGMVSLPPQGVAVYELNLSPGSPAPAAG